MLENIRNNTGSLWVKIAFGLIIIVFIFLGIGNYNTTSTVIAKVDDYEITEQDFLLAYNQQYERLRAILPNITDEELQQMQFPVLVLESLVTQALLANEAKRTGIDVTPRELFEIIAAFPFAQGANGKFDAEAYLAALKQAGQNPREFEDRLKTEMREGKFRNVLSNFAYVSEEQAKLLFDYKFEERGFDAYYIADSAFMNEVNPSDEELQAYYENRKQDFTLPASMSLEFIEISPEKLAKPEDITEVEIDAEYNKAPSLYDIPETVSASHILILLNETATPAEEEKALNTIKEIQDKLAAGGNFALLAQEYSQDPGSGPRGGSLGSFTRGQMVQEFETAAFTTAVGEVSEPVRSQFGYHLIQVHNKEAAQTPPKDELNEIISSKLAIQKAQSEVQSLLDSLLIQAHGSENAENALQAVAEKAGFEVNKTELLGLDALASSYNISNADMQMLLGLTAGSIAPSAIATQNGYLIAKVSQNLPDRTMDFEEVKPVILELAKKELAHEAALAKAEEVLKDTNAITKNSVKQYVTGRDGIFELGDSVELAEALFASETENAWLDKAFAVGEGYVLAKPTSIIPPSEEMWDMEKEAQIQELEMARRNLLYAVFINDLRANADVQILNSLYFE